MINRIPVQQKPVLPNVTQAVSLPRMSRRPIRLSTRALILIDQRLLLVNAWPSHKSDLWCAPGGGAEPHSALPANLAREVHEETGLTVTVGAPALVNEFHDPRRDFHQVDIYFRCTVIAGQITETWRDPEGIVTKRALFSRADMAHIRYKPDSLPAAAWDLTSSITYDALEPIVR